MAGSIFRLTGCTLLAIGVSTPGHVASAQTVRAWGVNGNGQCNVPADLGLVRALAGGSEHAVALRMDGTLRSWGTNSFGQASVPADLGPVSAIDAGQWHTVALLASGAVRCWGNNDWRQCIVPPDLGPVVGIAAGGNNTGVIRADGSVRCWGTSYYGVCDVPGNLGPVIALDAGNAFFVAVRADGFVRSWGGGLVPIPPDFGQAVAIAAGGSHAIALRADGSIRCWGNNDAGQCNVPSDLGPAVAVTGGVQQSVALRTDGTVRCWGSNLNGELNPPSDLGPSVTVAGGSNFTLALECGTPILDRSSGELGAIGTGVPRSFTFSNLLPALSAATIRIRVRGDLNLSSEFLTLRLDGVSIGTVFVTGANDCPATPDEATVTIPLKTLNGFLADGSITARLEASPLVSATQCPNGSCQISLRYQIVPVDCNGNGIDDGCELRISRNDCDGDGLLDSCAIAAGSAADVNANGRPDACEPDCNLNGIPDEYEIRLGLVADCNSNSIPDPCDLSAGSSTDYDGNGVPDSCQGDCNGNGAPDTYEILVAPWKDCDGDLILDSCEIASNPSLDCNGNGRLDSCEIMAAGGDCNGNGIRDDCEIAAGAQDKDGDGLLDDCEFARGDLDLDGEIGGGDLATTLVLWGLPNPPIGDLNGDGTVSGEDLTMLLVSWGTIPWRPSIYAITPDIGLPQGGTRITIRGAGLSQTSAVTIGGVAATVIANPDPSTLAVVTPPGQSGARDVVVTTAFGSANAVRGFRYAPIVVPNWATVLEVEPDPFVVTNAALRNAIIASGYPWRVRDNASQIEMLLVPPGTFNMGCSAAQEGWTGCWGGTAPVHAVTLTDPFYIGRYEVTNSQWTAVMGTGPWCADTFDPVTPRRPVEAVSWDTTQGFLGATGLRLPTEAEWEFACRAGTNTAFHSMPGSPNGTNDPSRVGAIAWYQGNSAGSMFSRAVGLKAPNALGLYDMSGNAWEWVNDWWDEYYYATSPSVNPTGPASGNVKVARGGSWGFDADGVRSSVRGLFLPWVSGCGGPGFRVARNP